MVRQFRLLSFVALILAVIFAVVGVIYLGVQCQHIPAPLPGREAGSTTHRVGFAAVALILAALSLLVAFSTRRPRRPSN